MAAPLALLLDAAEGLPFGCWADVQIERITTDSRVARAGDLFVGLPGSTHDGAAFAAQALRQGAVAVVLPLGAAPPQGAAGLCHPDPFLALATAAQRLYGDPGKELQLVGVTGTNGKTTTALLTAHLLAAGGGAVGYWTTTLVCLPQVLFRPHWTTPPAHELQQFLRAALDQGRRQLVIEVSSHAVVQRRIAGLQFAVGIATSFSPDHLDFHGSTERYHAAKRRFIQDLPPAAAIVLNRDDPAVMAMGREAAARLFTYGQTSEADVCVCDLRRRPKGLRGVLRLRATDLGPPGEYPFALPMVGTHNALNGAAAFATAVRLGVAPQTAAAALSEFEPPPRRLERFDVGPYVILNDVAMNEASFETVLHTVAELIPRNLVVVHALRGNRGREINRRTAEIFARWARKLAFAPLIVSESVSDAMRSDVDHRVRPEERDAFVGAAARSGLDVSLHTELDQALREAVDRLPNGGVLLLLGTFGMDRGPGLARGLLRRRLGLADDDWQGYLTPQDKDF